MMDLFKQLDKKTEKIIEKTTESLVVSLEDLSKRTLKECPLDTGDLRESYKVEINNKEIFKGTTSGPAKTGDVAHADVLQIVAYYDTDYAVIQHETSSFKHPEPGTKWKFLEDPFKAKRDEIVKDLNKAVEGALK